MKKTCRFSPFCVLECLSTLFRIRCHLCRLFISLVYKPLSYCAKVWICNKKWQFKMLVVLSPIFVADTKTTFGYNFVAPLNYLKVLTNSYYSIGLVTRHISNYMFGRVIWDKLPECNFKIFKYHNVDLSQKSPEPNMWLLVNHTYWN